MDLFNELDTMEKTFVGVSPENRQILKKMIKSRLKLNKAATISVAQCMLHYILNVTLYIYYDFISQWVFFLFFKEKMK